MIPIEKLSGEQITTIIAVINAIICVLLLLAGGIIGYWISDTKHKKKKKIINTKKTVVIKDDIPKYDNDYLKYEQLPLTTMIKTTKEDVERIRNKLMNALKEVSEEEDDEK